MRTHGGAVAVLLTLAMVAWVAAVAVCYLKGRWIAGIMGLAAPAAAGGGFLVSLLYLSIPGLLLGPALALGALVGALRAPRPGSWWDARNRDASATIRAAPWLALLGATAAAYGAAFLLIGAEQDEARRNLAGRDLRFAAVQTLDLAEADLSRANLEGLVLDRQDLHDSLLVGARAAYASFQGANLRAADLTDADLGGADFRFADLQGADLTGADLTGADLTGADLTDADLHGADLAGLRFDGATVWPQGFQPPEP